MKKNKLGLIAVMIILIIGICQLELILSMVRDHSPSKYWAMFKHRGNFLSNTKPNLPFLYLPDFQDACISIPMHCRITQNLCSFLFRCFFQVGYIFFRCGKWYWRYKMTFQYISDPHVSAGSRWDPCSGSGNVGTGEFGLSSCSSSLSKPSITTFSIFGLSHILTLSIFLSPSL